MMSGRTYVRGQVILMATILLAWELGGGLGHVMSMRPLAEGLARRGHRVVAVLRDLSSARDFITHPAVICLQAPFKHERMRDIEPTCSLPAAVPGLAAPARQAVCHAESGARLLVGRR
jgi:hypothetical protein